MQHGTQTKTVEFQQFSAAVCSCILLTQSTEPPLFPFHSYAVR